MKKVVLFRFLFLILAAVVVVFPSKEVRSSARPSEVQLTGTVSDSKCLGFAHFRKGYSAADCTRLCASQGYDYVLVAGKDVYPLQGDRKVLAKLIGEKVTVTGNLAEKPARAAYALMQAIETTAIVPVKN